MPRIYVPTTGPHDWHWLLAKPGLHWKHGASAMALASAWEAAATWPPEVAAALDKGGFGGLELLLGFPEREVPLPGGRRPSQTDLFVLARRRQDGLVAIAVEGKVAEPFGDHTVAQWRSTDPGPGREKRLAYLLGLLGLSDDARAARLRYQLLHRTASAVIEAQRFGAHEAIMLVHSFSATSEHFDDFAEFADALGARAAVGEINPAHIPGTELHLGWVTATAPPPAEAGLLGHRFDRAVALARVLHASQARKGTEIPYLAHLLAVASLVLDDGGTEDEAIAAILHDAVEDQGGKATLRRIDQLFGANVARIVENCSDTDVEPKPPWAERKQAYIERLADVDTATLRVSLADKLHNARAILFDLRTLGDQLWDRFNATKEQTLWYYGALADAFEIRYPGPMAAELRRTVDEIHRIAV